MYHKLKSILSALLPRRILFRYEPALRFLSYLPRAGTRFRCTLCGKGLRAFIPHEADRICPRCGSISRVRRLDRLLEEEFLTPGIRILDFSPSRSLYRKLKKGNWDYTASDLSGDFLAEARYDITSIDAPDHRFDLVICYHVLEHVEDDRKAMKELRRVTRAGGACIIQSPFRDGSIYEDPSIRSEKDRKAQFGQEDHVRVYSAEGLKGRLKEAGFEVEIRKYREEPGNRYGYKEEEIILLCRPAEQDQSGQPVSGSLTTTMPGADPRVKRVRSLKSTARP
jgi:SAM-dependent methyltransferase